MSTPQLRTVAVTGAAGFLGNTICRRLLAQGDRVRALVLPGDDAAGLAGLDVERVSGDITRASDLDRLLAGLGPHDALIHAASIVTIAWDVPARVREVNVDGTAQVLAACRRHDIGRLVYVSSVHALPERFDGTPVAEATHFDPALVVGGYAKTKAQATQSVLDAVRTGLDAVVVHPAGLLGPGDPGPGPQTSMVRDLVRGKLSAYVDGGYDFADVRDVADGTVAALDHGRSGECYLLSGRYIEMRELVSVVCAAAGRPLLQRKLPWALARALAPVMELGARVRGVQPQLTRYSMHTLRSPALFSHAKASAELGYAPRELTQTLTDMVAWVSPPEPFTEPEPASAGN